MKVLIVEDEYYARKAIVKMLKEWGKDTVIMGEAECGLDAIECINTEVWDLVFTDIRMPDMDGIKLAKYINVNYPSYFVFIISGYDYVQCARKEELGVIKRFLTKPVKKSELFMLLDSIKNIFKDKSDLTSIK